MDETTFFFTAADGSDIAVYRWSGGPAPKAIVQIAHGMGEHAARYRRLADALTAAGYVVYANDHRGHGTTAGSADHHGDLGAGGWVGLVSDLGELGAIARREHPGVPLVVVGHSMGSFALQGYLLDHSADVDAAVLSGTSAIDVIAPGIDPTKEVDLSAFNAAFEPARTEYDWLSRDPDEVDAYVADPACGFGLNPRGTASMLDGLADTGDSARLAGIRSDLPIYLLSGEADPLAGGGALIELVADRYRQAGVTDVTVALYPGARHEVFNEINRDEITADLVTWLDRITQR
jgi:alpha-beta hydrolase superfamily lysophospholipase